MASHDGDPPDERWPCRSFAHTLLFELLQRGVDVESVPKDDDIYDQSERSELISKTAVALRRA